MRALELPVALTAHERPSEIQGPSRAPPPPKSPRRFPVAAVVGLTAAAAAMQRFNAGETLSTTKMNGNFDELAARLSALEAAAAPDGGAFLAGSKFCGTGSPATGNLGGARNACKAVVACSANAHICTQDDIVRTMTVSATALSGTAGWYVGNLANDCASWTNPLSGRTGTFFDGPSGGYTSIVGCDPNHAIICCD